MKISVLGALNISVDGRDATPSAGKLRTLIAFLALRHDRVVTTEVLIEDLWGDKPPASALATLQTYVYQLRKLISGDKATANDVLVTRPVGYLLRLNPDDLDADVFERLVERGNQELHNGNIEVALELLDEACNMPSGQPLSDVYAGPRLAPQVSQLRERILQASELRAEAAQRLGHDDDLVIRLQELISEYPYHESFYARLMLVLQRLGRRSEALSVFSRLRSVLVNELGIEPSKELTSLQQSLLRADAPPGVGGSVVTKHEMLRPAQLPRDLPDFVARPELGVITDLVEGAAESALPIIAIAGPAGVGKSALAIRAAHRIRNRFPDAQFFAGGYTTDGMPSCQHQILGRFLRAIGIPDSELPDNVEERGQLFRSWTAERQALVVLDDVESTSQITQLLPGGQRCCVLITSRARLESLEGAYLIDLDVPDIDECCKMLARITGWSDIDANSDEVRTIVRLCGYNPLAIRAVGAQLNARPRRSLRDIAVRLADESTRLQALTVGELDPASRLRPSFRILSEEARRALRQLAGGGNSMTLTSISRILGMDLRGAENIVGQLVRKSFLQEVEAGPSGSEYFAMPTLVRLFVLNGEWGVFD